jgi:hypothetical protein
MVQYKNLPMVDSTEGRASLPGFGAAAIGKAATATLESQASSPELGRDVARGRGVDGLAAGNSSSSSGVVGIGTFLLTVLVAFSFLDFFWVLLFIIATCRVFCNMKVRDNCAPGARSMPWKNLVHSRLGCAPRCKFSDQQG